jgi:hypothetical protein
MTEMSFDDFAAPSSLSGGGDGYKRPALSQLSGRLLHVFPTLREDNCVTTYQPTPHTRITAELTFLDGDPIDRVIDKNGTVTAMMSPMVNPGQVMSGYWLNQKWLVNRLKDRVGQPGFPGMVGVLTHERGKSGNSYWALRDPSEAQMNAVRQWFKWRRQQGDFALYVPDPDPVEAQAPAAAPNLFGGAPAQAPAPNPFGGAPAPSLAESLFGQAASAQAQAPNPFGGFGGAPAPVAEPADPWNPASTPSAPPADAPPWMQ